MQKMELMWNYFFMRVKKIVDWFVCLHCSHDLHPSPSNFRLKNRKELAFFLSFFSNKIQILTVELGQLYIGHCLRKVLSTYGKIDLYHNTSYDIQ